MKNVAGEPRLEQPSGGDKIGPCERVWGVGQYIIYDKAVNRPATNDSRCLNTMLIFDGKDGRSSYPSFLKTFLLVLFSC